MIENRIAVVAQRKGYTTIKSLADAVGVSENAIGQLWRGQVRQIRFDTLDRLCRALEVDPGELLRYKPAPLTHPKDE